MKLTECVSASCWLSHRAEEQWGDIKCRWRHMTEKLCKQGTQKDAYLTSTHTWTNSHVQGGAAPACLFLSARQHWGVALCVTLSVPHHVHVLHLSCVKCRRGLLDVTLLWSREGWMKGWQDPSAWGFGLFLKMLQNLFRRTLPTLHHLMCWKWQLNSDCWVIITARSLLVCLWVLNGVLIRLDYIYNLCKLSHSETYIMKQFWPLITDGTSYNTQLTEHG